MPRAALSVAEVFRRHGVAFRAEVGDALSTAQRRVTAAIERCRTAALGGHVEQCDHCGHRRVWYNSCRNRHCPTCQPLARAEWLARRRADLPLTEYFHVVVTVPPAVAEIATQNKTIVYGLLFRAVADTLRRIAADPRHLGAEIGFFAALHSCGHTLVHHPHVHCVPDDHHVENPSAATPPFVFAATLEGAAVARCGWRSTDATLARRGVDDRRPAGRLSCP